MVMPMSDETGDGSTTAARIDDGNTAHTIRLELEDEPGRLHHALGPITEQGGNLRSIHHERGNRTPRGTIPVEIELACAPSQFDAIVASLQTAGVSIIEAGSHRYETEVTVLLVGHLVDTDFSDTLSQIEAFEHASVSDASIDAPEGTEGVSAALLRLAVDDGRVGAALDAVRTVAEEKELTVVEPLAGGER